jgi:hypothetical protein
MMKLKTRIRRGDRGGENSSRGSSDVVFGDPVAVLPAVLPPRVSDPSGAGGPVLSPRLQLPTDETWADVDRNIRMNPLLTGRIFGSSLFRNENNHGDLLVCLSQRTVVMWLGTHRRRGETGREGAAVAVGGPS